jgi:hypothetical protein
VLEILEHGIRPKEQVLEEYDSDDVKPLLTQ